MERKKSVMHKGNTHIQKAAGAMIEDLKKKIHEKKQQEIEHER